MRFYRNLAFFALVTSTLSPASSAPTPRQRMYGNLLVEFKGRVLLISGIPLGTLGWIPLSMPLMVSDFLVPEFVSKFALALPKLVLNTVPMARGFPHQPMLS